MFTKQQLNHRRKNIVNAARKSGVECIAYNSIEQSAFERQMKERGIPDLIVRRTTGFLTDIKNGQEAEVSPEIEHLLGRKPASLKEALKVGC
ncbi:hypothetical protein CAL7716_042570 [Calothrix sp. PCC 7716]|nr:hypothetical protein CAL7716_042570 [Calothrix sp. PCC 7716]